MTVAVIGGAGFIGSNLVDTLLAEGHQVSVLDNLSEGTLDNLPEDTCHLRGELEFVRGDIRSYTDVVRVVDRCDWVFHLAAMSRIQPSIKDPTLAFEQNVLGTVNVLEACRKHGVSRVVYSASSSAYGRKNPPPHREHMPTDCLNPYSLSKKVGEELMELYRRLYGLSTVSLRYFNVYGPKHQESGDYATVIAIFLRQLREGRKMTVVGTGEQRRDFTFVGDVVRANVMAAMNRDVVGTVNIGTGRNHSIMDVARACAAAFDVEWSDDLVEHIEPRKGEAEVTLADVTRARSELGWEPKVSLEEGLPFTKSVTEFLSGRGGVTLL